MLYPTSIAAFKKFKNKKNRYLTEAESTGSSWVFSKLINPYAKLDIHKNLKEFVSIFKNFSF